DWVSDQENRIAFPVRKRHNFWDSGRRKTKISKKKLRKLRDFLNQGCSGKTVGRDRTSQRLHRLGQVTGLTRTDIDILELLVRYNTHTVFESMIDEIFECPGRSTCPLNIRGRALPMALGLSANKVQLRLKGDAPLVRTGLVKIDSDGDLKSFRGAHRLIAEPGDGNVDPIRLLLDTASQSDLAWRDFDHVAVHRDHIESLVKGALDKRAHGVNILLYGPPGTGKTEFCKVLAGHLGLTLYSVGEVDEDGEEPTRGERLQELRLAQNLLDGNRQALLLFDEMEDLLATSYGGFEMFGAQVSMSVGSSASKVYVHRLLETSPVPILWTMNDAREVNPATLRRMMFALELRLPTAPVRARVWARQLDSHGIEAAPEDVLALASEFEAPPGVAAGATVAASLAGGDVATVRRGVNSLSRLLSCGMPPQGTSFGFDPALIRADTDPAALAERLSTAGTKNFSLCLQGPPGTGKSAYVRYLAERLGLEVLQKRTSDLMSMWVGQTERLIASTFAEARDTGAFLVFDEADSLLADRRAAQRNWEVSQVNEMLTWMENHPLPFACTTNFGEHFDPATLRRFVFKITLDYLTPEQVNSAFRSFFDLPPPAPLAMLATLTPGDFAVVHRKAGALGLLQNPDALAGMLQAECAVKPDRPRVIGFRQ
ncbi:MAG: AAA family ATPase, partial [Rhodobacteraceae bacterium]|nr:AAA family ATPase [Paracoccaceae bacterium]